MKKQILIIAVISFITVGFNSLMAQERPEKPDREQAETLTDAQIETINNILADYDSKSVSEEDANAIMKAIHEAKIPGGKGVEDAINAAGFDFEEIRELAPPPSRGGKKRN